MASIVLPVEVHARFENGVFVPEGKVQQEEHQRVTAGGRGQMTGAGCLGSKIGCHGSGQTCGDVGSV